MSGQMTVQEAVAGRETKALSQEDLAKTIRGWGWWMLGWGVFSLIAGQISWALVLFVLGGMAMLFHDEAAMLIAFAGVMLWVALWNLLFAWDSGGACWTAIQVASALGAFQQYAKFRGKYHTSRGGLIVWLTLALGGLGLLGACMGFLSLVGLAMLGVTDLLLGGEIVYGMIELSALAAPLGLAAVVSGHQPRSAAILGTGLGLVALVLDFVLPLMA